MKLALIILIFFYYNFAFSQNNICPPKVQYTYDDAGNRILRQQAPCKLSNDNDSLNPPNPQNFATQPNYEVKLYPNPTKGEMLAEATWDFMLLENRMVYIFGMKGEMLYKSTISEPKFPLDFTTFAPGYYIVQVSANEYNKKWKVQRE